MAFRPTSAVRVHVFGPRGSGVEHFLGKEGVTGSNPVVGSRIRICVPDGHGSSVGGEVEGGSGRQATIHIQPAPLQVEHPCRAPRSDQRVRPSGEASEDHGEGKV